MKVKRKVEESKNVKYIYIKSNKKKARCLKSNRFNTKIHDYLKQYI